MLRYSSFRAHPRLSRGICVSPKRISNCDGRQVDQNAHCLSSSIAPFWHCRFRSFPHHLINLQQARRLWRRAAQFSSLQLPHSCLTLVTPTAHSTLHIPHLGRLNPLCKLPPRLPHIPEPPSLLKRPIRIPRRALALPQLPLLTRRRIRIPALALDLAGPLSPVDRPEGRRGEDDGDEEEERAGEGFDGDVGGDGEAFGGLRG